MKKEMKWVNILAEINKEKNKRIWENIDRILIKMKTKWKKY
jgi:hypothetical protein